MCVGIGGHLVSILSAAEQSFVSKIAASKTYWIGALIEASSFKVLR